MIPGLISAPCSQPAAVPRVGAFSFSFYHSLVWLVALATLLAGCEYVLSDVATRIRYRLHAAVSELKLSTHDSVMVSLRPDHWPDECPKRAGYRLVISPYRGGKQVATGDIAVTCRGGRSYSTGLGLEELYVAQDLAVEKGSDEDLHITLHKTSSGVEIVGLE